MKAPLAAKTAALLLGGRVTVLIADDLGTVIADVEGSTVPHRVTLGHGGWTCTCQASKYGRRCSHATAVQLVTDHPCRAEAVAALDHVRGAAKKDEVGQGYAENAYPSPLMRASATVDTPGEVEP